ncbi:WhiB family transcriptional regulator [Gordonia otitidis]|uniref:WhiB family regulatory protein n=1 Tax=Gordonia otitidis (strain DSM 44809 / CCUG 52243 / JCM 12355 / NBRC 100426 / IFM 10032) TaxID=1108044 RepID=H5TRQ5_GORO1|nr:WhiB family transcriptional regulator [Gordonia otitidis]GAB36163.1 putative WhiB family regulatory protein [Gordonia otitidis NBRC 100426]
MSRTAGSLLLPLATMLAPSTDVDWAQAHCARPGEDAEQWHPVGKQKWDHARQVCAGCPLALECQAFGRDTHQWGVWGGRNLENGKPTAN